MPSQPPSIKKRTLEIIQQNQQRPESAVKFYNYEDFERQDNVRTQILQIINRKFEVMWPLDLATAKFVSPS